MPIIRQRAVLARWAAMLLLTTVLTAPIVGCSRGDGRLAVSGSVTLDGQPLERGSVNFRPAPGNQAPSSGGTIDQGEFTLPTAHGLKPGEYLVTIQAFRRTGRMVDDPQMGKIEEMAPIEFQEPMPKRKRRAKAPRRRASSAGTARSSERVAASPPD